MYERLHSVHWKSPRGLSGSASMLRDVVDSDEWCGPESSLKHPGQVPCNSPAIQMRHAAGHARSPRRGLLGCAEKSGEKLRSGWAVKHGFRRERG